MEHSPPPMNINPDLGSAVYVALCLQPPVDSSMSPSSFLSIFPYTVHCTCWMRQNTSYISARGRREGEREPPGGQVTANSKDVDHLCLIAGRARPPLVN